MGDMFFKYSTKPFSNGPWGAQRRVVLHMYISRQLDLYFSRYSRKNQTKILASCFLPLFVNQKNTKLHFTTTASSYPNLFFPETAKNISDAWKLSNVTS